MSFHTGQLAGHDYIYVSGGSRGKVVLLLLHGTGGDESKLLQLGEDISASSHYLSPRGNVIENGHRRFFKRHGEGIFDEDDIKKRAKELKKFIESAKSAHKLDGKEIVAVGYSNGANIAASVMLLHPGVIKKAVMFRPMLPLRPADIPDLHGSKILMTNGIQDPLVPHPNVEELRLLLESYGAEVDQYWLPTGHQLTSQDVLLAKKWVAKIEINI